MSGKLPRHVISQIGESALLVSWGNRVSEGLNAAIHQLIGLLRASRLNGVRDIVPAFASILFVFDDEEVSEAQVVHWLEDGITAFEKANASSITGPTHHTIPVQYGGEGGLDLDDLAAQEGTTPRAIIKAHTQRPFQVAFLGFLPGFAYMGRLPRRTPVPRLATPRMRVPAGSVGMAGFQTGIYPFASPGGWRIIGRTGVPIWDPRSDIPALFAPGDTVQFVESRSEPGTPERLHEVFQPARPAFEVVQAGGICVIQDLGRTGLMHLGVGQSGAFDTFAAQRANMLVGNDPGAAVLEIALGGPELRVTRNVTIALDGADFHCRADNMLIPPRLSWFARAGTTLRFGTGSSPINEGMRAYLAVAGGFDVPDVLGSRSTSLLAGFGGFGGRALRSGDVLGVGAAPTLHGIVAGRYWPGKVRDISHQDITVRFTPFKGVQAAQPGPLRQFIETTWLITEQSDRMGLRLRSTDVTSLQASSTELASFGVVPGAIQLPRAGQPVVLGPDCQTTGGYPLLGVVISADMPLLAQAVPGAHVTFVSTGLEEARAARQLAQADLSLGANILSRGST
jgi:KipI family sensor histidine kinase inhibitor